MAGRLTPIEIHNQFTELDQTRLAEEVANKGRRNDVLAVRQAPPSSRDIEVEEVVAEVDIAHIASLPSQSADSELAEVVGQ
eukprot:14050911-Heterocapsa_arctica.AAC.1